jgi:hypothetical protein
MISAEAWLPEEGREPLRRAVYLSNMLILIFLFLLLAFLINYNALVALGSKT